MRNPFLLLIFLSKLSWGLDINLELEDATEDYIQETYQKALKAFVDKKYEESLKYIRHVIKSNFQDYRLRILAGYCHWNLGNHDKAIIHFSKLAEIDPQNPFSYTELAALYLSQNQYTKAEQVLRKGLGRIIAVGDVRVIPRFYNLLARSLLMQGKLSDASFYVQKAKATYSSAEDNKKERVEALILESRLLSLEGKIDKAIFLLDWATSIAEKDPYTWNFLGILWQLWANKLPSPEKEVKKQKAKEAFEKALSLNPEEKLRKIIEYNLSHL